MSDQERETLVVNLAGNWCARCGEDGPRHPSNELTFTRFINPIEDSDGTVWGWWALCPVTHDPVLLRQWVIEDEGAA